MRKITILIATCILFIMPSCTKSNEDKAEELISKCIKENMSYPDSYEAISTKVDSSFVKVSTIIEILDLSEDVFSDISKIRAIKSDISSAQTTKEIYTPTGFYDSAHSLGEYKRAIEEISSNTEKLNQAQSKLIEKIKNIKNVVASLEDQKQFCNWVVEHKFRYSQAKDGNKATEDMIFYCDKNFENCRGWTVDQFKRISYFLNELVEANSDNELIEIIGSAGYLSMY